MATSHCRPGVGELANVLRDFGSLEQSIFNNIFHFFKVSHKLQLLASKDRRDTSSQTVVKDE